MYKLRMFLKKIFTPVTIMLIPHSSTNPINIKFPSIAVALSVFLWVCGSVFVISVAIDTLEYYHMKERLAYYTSQFMQLESAIKQIKSAEAEFKKLLSNPEDKKAILEKVQMPQSDATGSADLESLKESIKQTIETVSDIREFLKEQKSLYHATPQGWPVQGRVTSEFGNRLNPFTNRYEFHPAIDISTPHGSPIKATADGIVSFSGWSYGNGNLIVIEHGFGFSTLYAHNKTNLVSVGQKVKRGDIIAYVGATGNATGPHLHYEVWKDGIAQNPLSYIGSHD